MQIGDLKLWRSQIVCWSLFASFSVLAVLFLCSVNQPLTKSHPEVLRYDLLAAGSVLACLASLFLILAWRSSNCGGRK
jgi:hypothetical protein